MKITLATTPEELQAVHRLRYEVYVQEMKRPQQYADHQRRTIIDPLDPFAHVLAAWQNGQVVGTVRLNLLRDGDIGDYYRMYEFHRVPARDHHACSITTRLMVRPELRSGTLAMRLAKEVYRLGLNLGVTTDLIDTNPPLDTFFARLGHRTFSDSLHHPEYGQVVVMKLDLRDETYLKQIRSPFAPILSKWKREKTQTITKSRAYDERESA